MHALRAMWPFKKKKDRSLTEYNKLRSLVGMAPASNDDYCEGIAWVIVYDLFAAEVGEECERLPASKRDLFMMVYATYLSWLAMKGVTSHFPLDSWQRIFPMLQREISKQPWYQPEVMDRLFDSMVKYSPMGTRKGRNFSVAAGPWFEAEMAAKLAGFEMDFSTNPRFALYVSVISGRILETIAKMAPSQDSI